MNASALPWTAVSAFRFLWKAIRSPLSTTRAAYRRYRQLSNERWWSRNRASVATRTIRLSEGGEKLRIYSDSKLCELISNGHFEIDEQRFLRVYLRSGDVFLDVGSNIGIFTVIAAKILGSGGTVHAFEPSAGTFERLRSNVRLNRLTNVCCNAVALSADETPLTLYQSTDGYDAWNSAAGPLGGASHHQAVCPTTTLDAYVAAKGIQPQLVKIDVEGWESNVLAGGAGLLGGPSGPDLLVEFTEQNCVAAGTSGHSLFLSIERLGYQLFHFDSDLTMRAATDQDDFSYCNLFCTKNSAAAMTRIREGRRPS